MSELIEVRYKAVFFEGVKVYHKYIVYTNTSGQQYATRGGPTYGSPLDSPGSGDDSTSNSSGSP